MKDAEERKKERKKERKMDNKSRFILIVSLHILTILFFIQTAFSETQTLEEIVVTAKKQPEEISKSSLSATVLSNQEIRDRGASSFEDYLNTLPGVTYIPNRYNGSQIVTIRGVYMTSSRFNQSTTGMFIDEIDITHTFNFPNLQLVDMERIEVLKGPQGTLYGSSSMGGTIRYITKKPDLNQFTSEIESKIENTEHGGWGYGFNAMLNTPVIEDKLGLRFVGYYQDLDGWIDGVGHVNPMQGFIMIDETSAKADMNTNETIGGRGTLNWQITPQCALELVYLKHKNDNPTINMYNPNIGDLEDGSRTSEALSDNSDIYSLVVDYAASWSDIKWISTYSDLDYRALYDTSKMYGGGFMYHNVGQYTPAYDADCDCIRDLDGSVAGHPKEFWPYDYNRQTHELRFTNHEKSLLKWVAGVYYSFDDNTNKIQFITPGVASNFIATLRETEADSPSADSSALPRLYNILENDDYYLSVRDEEIEQMAVYTHLTWPLFDFLDVNAGLRWFDVENNTYYTKQGYRYMTNAPLDPDDPHYFDLLLEAYDQNNTAETLHYEEDGIQLSSGLSYYLTDQDMLFFNWSQGFRLGGINRNIPVSSNIDFSNSFDSDHLDSYELGLKSLWNHNRFMLNAAIFYIDWKDIQITLMDPETRYGYMSNAGNAEVKGIEVDMRMIPAPGVQLSAGASYLDHGISEVSQNAMEKGFTADKGDKLPFVMDFNAYLAASYERQISKNFNGFIRGELNYIGDYQSNLNDAFFGFFEYGDFFTANLNMGLVGDQWSLSLMIKNVLDENEVISAEPCLPYISGDWGQVQTVKPRTCQLTFRYTF
jgi:iron complex outermembrane receptor protein